MAICVVLFTGIAVQAFSPYQKERQAFRDFLVHWEGHTSVPIDLPGETIVGIGHNLSVHPDELRARRKHYSKAEITLFFDRDYEVALSAAKRALPTFDSLPQDVQWVVLSIAWTCGPTGLRDWSAFLAAIKREDYGSAALELEKSQWEQQVGTERVLDHYMRLSRYANTTPIHP